MSEAVQILQLLEWEKKCYIEDLALVAENFVIICVM
jgi:hypothetical protein